MAGVLTPLRRTPARAAIFLALLAAISCSGAPAAPSAPSSTSLAGRWSGDTFQGRPISFTVSQANLLTELVVDFAIDSCVGGASFNNLSVPVGVAGGSRPTAFFSYGARPAENAQVGISVQGYAMPDGSITGGVVIYGTRSCGPSESVAGPFSATRR